MSAVEVLEWPFLQRELATRALTRQGKKNCESLLPYFRGQEGAGVDLRVRAAAILELLSLNQDKNLRLPLTDIPDIEILLKRISRSGKISVAEFADLVRVQKAVQGLSYFLQRYASTSKNLTKLLGHFDLLEDWSREHFRLLTPQGDLVDSASEDLRALRKLESDLKKKIEERLEEYLHNPRLAELMQDFYVTVRDGRYVVPIKTNFRGRVPGIIHDVSHTEQTLFVEPQEVVEHNNQLKVTEKEIEKEIERILEQVVERTQPVIAQMLSNQALLAESDLCAAAADLAQGWGLPATVPQWGHAISAKNLRHPLLALKQKVVPNSLSWKGALVLTGPNTGGKTVLLKSLGLAVCLAQAGLPVPAESFELPQELSTLWADIGDDQNLEENLSTFSGHLVVLKKMLQESAVGDLVLIDEIATGTSPEDGQPLAQALIEALLDKGVRVVVTTHYGALKNFAMNDDRCRIAAMALDPKTKQPTYELILDIPGNSSAFEAAEQMDFPRQVIDRARALKGEVSEDLTNAIKRLEGARERLSSQEELLREAETRALEREERAQQRLRELEARQRESLAEEARHLLKDFQGLREELSKAVKAASLEDLEAGATKLFTKISDGAEKLRSFKGETGSHEFALQPLGDDEIFDDAIVEVEGIGTGTLNDVPKSFDAKTLLTVQVGEIKMRIQRARLRKPAFERKQKFITDRSASLAARGRRLNETSLKSPGSSASGSTLCDVRGKTVDEAMRKVENALNELARDENATVTIIHGHGSDRLKESLRNYLSKEREDLVFRAGSWPGEGGDGVTVVERAR